MTEIEKLLKAAQWALSLCDEIGRSKTKSKLLPEATSLATELSEAIEGYKASSNTVAPVDNIVESEEKKSWFDENVHFVGWFNKSGLNPFTTSYEEAYKQFKEQTKEVSTEKKIPPKPQMNHWGASAADYEQYRQDLNEWEEKYGNQSTNPLK